MPHITKARTDAARSVTDRPVEVRAAAQQPIDSGRWGTTKHGVEIVMAAMGQLRPHLVINRDATEFERAMLRGADLRTWWNKECHAEDLARVRAAQGAGHPIPPDLYRGSKRISTEVLRGFVGSGDTLGKTVYGTVQWDTVRTLTNAAGKRVIVPNDGIEMYGNIAGVLDAAYAWRCTFTATDSMDGGTSQLAALEQFVDVAHANLVDKRRVRLDDVSERVAVQRVVKEMRAPLEPYEIDYLEIQGRGKATAHLVELREAGAGSRSKLADLERTNAERARLRALAERRGLQWTELPPEGLEPLKYGGRWL